MSEAKTATDVDAFIGEKIRGLRNQQKMSQEELGTRLGVSFQQVQKYEKGTNRLSGSRLQMAASIFKISVADLFPPQLANGKLKKLSTADRVLATRDGAKLIDSFAAIKKDELRAALVELARRFEEL